jgi:4-amino-4-deoxy-L-arabinose transferase-like glycosyltransferase
LKKTLKAALKANPANLSIHLVTPGPPAWAAGLAMLTKQTVLLFLLLPLLWTGLILLWQRRPLALLQWLLGVGLATAIAYPWYRTNWLLILTSSQRATVEAAIAEGDPALNTLGAWTYYLQLFPEMLSYPLLILAGLGFLVYGRRLARPEAVPIGAPQSDVSSALSPPTPEPIPVKARRQLAWRQWWRSVRWLLVFVVGAYFLSSLNINKDDRYITPMLPILAVLLAQGLTLLPYPSWRWSGVGLVVLMMLTTLFPLLPGWESDGTTRFAVRQAGNWHHADVVETMLQAEPYQRHTLGVLPSVPELNQHNMSYYGNLRNFQVHGRQVGAADRQVWSDSRALSWYLIKTGNQGAIRQPKALKALTETIIDNPDLKLQSRWELPDRSDLKLYRRRRAPVQVQPWSGALAAPVALQTVQVPPVALPGEPLPVKYQWVGNWDALQNGVVVLNWKWTGALRSAAPPSGDLDGGGTPQPTPPATRWLHDHGIGLGLLAGTVDPLAAFQVTERLAMLPPQSAAGIYTLEATYLNRKTGDSYDLTVPPVQVAIDPQAKPIAARELDPLTQFRLLTGQMPQGVAVLDKVFAQVARMNTYDPTQDYLEQAQVALNYRLQQEPQNAGFAYGWALSQALQRHVEGAIAGMGRVAALDSKNPNAYAYLGVVNLYDWRAGDARSALQSGLDLQPDSRELRLLMGIADLMQGNLVKAVQAVQQFQATAPK